MIFITRPALAKLIRTIMTDVIQNFRASIAAEIAAIPPETGLTSDQVSAAIDTHLAPIEAQIADLQGALQDILTHLTAGNVQAATTTAQAASTATGTPAPTPAPTVQLTSGDQQSPAATPAPTATPNA